MEKLKKRKGAEKKVDLKTLFKVWWVKAMETAMTESPLV